MLKSSRSAGSGQAHIRDPLRTSKGNIRMRHIRSCERGGYKESFKTKIFFCCLAEIYYRFLTEIEEIVDAKR